MPEIFEPAAEQAIALVLATLVVIDRPCHALRLTMLDDNGEPAAFVTVSPIRALAIAAALIEAASRRLG